MFLNLDKKEIQKTAAIDGGREELTYGDLVVLSGEFFKVLPHRTLIFIMSRNSLGALVGYVAALSNKIVPLILSVNTEVDLYEHLRDLYQPEYLWIPTELVDKYGYKKVFSLLDYSLVKTDLVAPVLHDDLALLLPTSGSTGSPKLVRHSYRNIEANAENVSQMFQITPLERAMATLPMHYTMGLSVITSHLYSGATLLFSDKSLLDKEFWTMLKEEKATSFTGVPYSYEVLRKMRFFRMDLPFLKVITQGGGKLREDLFRECVEYAEKNGKKFIATYGQTEGTARMAFLEPEMAKYKIGSIGKAEPNGRLAIIDSEGNKTFEGEAEGEMIYYGENVTLGYAMNSGDLMKGDENRGVLYTGDIVHRDVDGFYYVIGRMKRFLKIFGLRIGLDEIEYLVKSNFDTDCLCSGSDELLKICITNFSLSESIKNFVVEKTHLFHKNIEIIYSSKIERNEAGKACLKNY
ncbi:AMP-binding protein [Butyricimonas synergistica]|uniref:AMP-binding protein n=1 Tax=Butyricimonas synergistica TaxID=544644 RepID=UPI000365AE14|nr:AMP-binding protein [Butyricimonas synergistica]